LEVNMRTSQYRHYARRVQEQTVTLLTQQLRPRDFSQRCTAGVLLSCLVLAAACRLALAAVAALRPRCPSRETLRQALLETLPDYQQLLRRLPALLRAALPRSLRQRPARRRYPMAIDLHAVPFYKRQRTPPPQVRKGKRLPGTAYSHQYATAALLRKGQYYTVALTPYAPGEDLATLVRRLLRQAAHNGFVPRYVLMDRSFWATEVFRYLQRARYPFLIPLAARGKKPSAPGGPTGTYVFLHRCPSGRYPYRVRTRQRQTAALTIVVHRRNRGGRRGRHGRYAWAYGLWRMELSAIPWVRESYRRRFRIESSYRLMEAVRGRTSSRNEGWRLWYVVLAVLLLNRWLELRREISRGDGSPASEQRWWNRLLVALIWLLLLEDAETVERPTPTHPPLRQ
jgi:putative transposase